MKKLLPLPIEELSRAKTKRALLSGFICDRFADRGGCLQILEAGCGRNWSLDLNELAYDLTGIDVSKDALDSRQREHNDLRRAIVGDLRTVDLPSEQYDVIYCSNVLEHISGAKTVLDRFFDWLKPGGALVLLIPDRNTFWGWATRTTPHWMHVCYYRYVKHKRLAGTRGHGPYPTPFDNVVSLKGVRGFCEANGHRILMEYGDQPNLKRIPGPLRLFLAGVERLFGLLSGGHLTAGHAGLIYIIQKKSVQVG